MAVSRLQRCSDTAVILVLSSVVLLCSTAAANDAAADAFLCFCTQGRDDRCVADRGREARFPFLVCGVTLVIVTLVGVTFVITEHSEALAYFITLHSV
jgi:hypothetical protein